MANRFRTFVFDNYPWIIPLLLAGTVGLLVVISKPENLPTNIIAATGVALSLVYFIQKQALEQIEHFEELFTGFNERYSGMHDRLQEMANSVNEGRTVPGRAERTLLDQYFNLCSEEYLFYSQGCILPVVWQSWCRGMLWYLENTYIYSIFNAEVRPETHYGLSLSVIEQGAGRALHQIQVGNANPPTPQ